MIEFLHRYHLGWGTLIFAGICMVVAMICFIVSGAYDDDSTGKAWNDLE